MSKSFLIQDGNDIKYIPDSGMLTTIGQIPYTEEMFNLHGMINLSLFTPVEQNLITNNKYSIALLTKHVLYGFDIDESISDPSSAVTYTDDAVGFTPISVNSSGIVDYGSWKDSDLLNGNKPCLLKNGKVNYYLNPNDYTKKEDGSSSDIISGNDGDVMAEFNQMWYKFEKNGNIISFRLANYKVDDSYCSNAFISEADYSTLCPHMYIGTYNGYSLSSKLRSLSGVLSTVNTNIGQFRTLATANGPGYQQLTFSKYQYLAALLVLVSKSRNIQAALGNGRCSSNSQIQNGSMNNKGQFWGNFDSVSGVKTFHIENLYGNIWQCLDGLGNSYMQYKYKNIGPYNDYYSDYISGGTIPGSGYTKSMIVNNNILLPSINGGTNTTYYSDYLYSSNFLCVCCVGGYWSDALRDGPFYLYLFYSASSAITSLGSRSSFTGI